MSLRDELRAQKFAFADSADKVAKIEGQDLRAVTSEAGCSMLFVYLLNRWGSWHQPGALAKLGANGEVHERILRAYLAAGCRPDEAVAVRKLGAHLPPAFAYQVQLKGEHSPLSFAQRMLQEIVEDMDVQAHAQLLRVVAILSGNEATPDEVPAASGLDEAWAYLVRGRAMRSEVSDLTDLRAGMQGQAIQVFVAGDEGEARGEVDVILGVEVAAVGANAGGPIRVTQLGDPTAGALWLLATGPLASAKLVRGQAGSEDAAGDGSFHRGLDMEQSPHRIGVWGERVMAVAADARELEASLDEGELDLIASYD